MKIVDGEFWVITSYFNPMGSKRRFENYREFRRELNAPLVTVEWVWTKGQTAQLTNEDAEIFRRVAGPDLLWQKERMLNEAISILPPECKYVAWLDSDVLFDNPEWKNEVVGALQKHPMVQPYSICVNLGPNRRPIAPDKLGGQKKQTLANPKTRNAIPQNALRHELRGMGVGCGHAWAARIDLLRDHGLYDACILGSGDRAMFSAAIGRFQDASEYMRMNPCRTAHYLDWAAPFFAATKANLGWIPGRIHHLWHGSIIDRRYEKRHQDFAVFDFEPQKDIRKDEYGSWRWSNSNSAMVAFVEEYFRHRNEDGEYLTSLSEAMSTGRPQYDKVAS